MCEQVTCKAHRTSPFLSPAPSFLFWTTKLTGEHSFGITGVLSCIIGYFVLPEIACRAPAEIDEMFEKRVAPRKFRNYVTEVEMFNREKAEKEELVEKV